MFSKSIFGNYSQNEKSIINPVLNTTISFYNNELKFSIEEYVKLNNFIENRNEYIFDDTISYEEYIDLLNIISNLEIKTNNQSIQLVTANHFCWIQLNLRLSSMTLLNISSSSFSYSV